MFKNNNLESSKFKGCKPLQPSFNLTGLSHTVSYYFYTERWFKNL